MSQLKVLIPMIAVMFSFTAPSFAQAPETAANPAVQETTKKDKTLVDGQKSKHSAAKKDSKGVGVKKDKGHKKDCKCDGKKCDGKECKNHKGCEHCKGKGCEHCKTHEHKDGEKDDGHGEHHHHEDHGAKKE